VKTTTPLFWWRTWSIPSKPPLDTFLSMQAFGHHRLLLQKPSALGMASPTRRQFEGDTICERLNQGRLSKRMPATVTSADGYGHRLRK